MAKVDFVHDEEGVSRVHGTGRHYSDRSAARRRASITPNWPRLYANRCSTGDGGYGAFPALI